MMCIEDQSESIQSVHPFGHDPEDPIESVEDRQVRREKYSMNPRKSDYYNDTDKVIRKNPALDSV